MVKVLNGNGGKYAPLRKYMHAVFRDLILLFHLKNWGPAVGWNVDQQTFGQNLIFLHYWQLGCF